MQVGSVADSVPCALVSCVCFGTLIIIVLTYFILRARPVKVSSENKQVISGTFEKIAENEGNQNSPLQPIIKPKHQPKPHNKSEERDRRTK